jgi:homocysteine S-methyltransferase
MMPRSNALSRLLDSGENLVLDGALATELEAHGCDLEDPLWSAKVLLEQPELVKRVHLDYFKAGARVAITASYQATPLGFARRGIPEAEALERVAMSVRLADEARREYLAGNPESGPLLVAGSVGPYGAYLADGSEYRGDYTLTRNEFVEFHRPRVAALVAAGADVLACETLPSLPEAEALLELIAEFDVESWLTFTLRDGAHISDGTPLEQVAELCNAEPLVAAIGVNCVPLELVTPALDALSPGHPQTAGRVPQLRGNLRRHHQDLGTGRVRPRRGRNRTSAGQPRGRNPGVAGTWSAHGGWLLPDHTKRHCRLGTALATALSSGEPNLSEPSYRPGPRGPR